MAVTAYTFDMQMAVAYLEVCFQLYRDDPNWIPPLRERVLAQFSSEFAFYRQRGNVHRHFLATAASKPIGHASAIVNSQLKDHDGDPIGAIGFFECIEDAAIAAELLDHAIEWMRIEHGIRRVWAPMQFDVWHGYRFMTRGFEGPVFFGEPYNKSYYPGFFASHGFTIRKRWYSLEVAGRGPLQSLIEPCRNAHERALADGYRFAAIDVRDPATVVSLQSVIEASYRNFLGLSPLPSDQFQEIFADYARALDQRFAIAALDGRGSLCGFAIAYPDYGQAIRAMRGRDSVVARLRFYLRSRNLNRAVFFMIGITPEQARRRRGLGRALHYRCVSALLEAGFESVVFALLAEDSPGWPLIGNRKDEAQKEYALYEAAL